jgi:hypothetical protein
MARCDICNQEKDPADMARSNMCYRCFMERNPTKHPAAKCESEHEWVWKMGWHRECKECHEPKDVYDMAASAAEWKQKAIDANNELAFIDQTYLNCDDALLSEGALEIKTNAQILAKMRSMEKALRAIERIPSCQEEGCCYGGKAWSLAFDALKEIYPDFKPTPMRDINAIDEVDSSHIHAKAKRMEVSLRKIKEFDAMLQRNYAVVMMQMMAKDGLGE